MLSAINNFLFSTEEFSLANPEVVIYTNAKSVYFKDMDG
jgi:hypothetical protein